MGTEDAQVAGYPRDIMEELLQNTLSANEVEQLCRSVTAREIKEAMFSIGNDKAPGPDGYSSYFLKWPGLLLEEMWWKRNGMDYCWRRCGGCDTSFLFHR